MVGSNEIVSVIAPLRWIARLFRNYAGNMRRDTEPTCDVPGRERQGGRAVIVGRDLLRPIKKRKGFGRTSPVAPEGALMYYSHSWISLRFGSFNLARLGVAAPAGLRHFYRHVGFETGTGSVRRRGSLRSASEVLRARRSSNQASKVARS